MGGVRGVVGWGGGVFGLRCTSKADSPCKTALQAFHYNTLLSFVPCCNPRCCRYWRLLFLLAFLCLVLSLLVSVVASCKHAEPPCRQHSKPLAICLFTVCSPDSYKAGTVICEIDSWVLEGVQLGGWRTCCQGVLFRELFVVLACDGAGACLQD